LKILFVVPCYQPATRFGGPIKSIHALANELATQGAQIEVFTTNSNGPYDLAVPCGKATWFDQVRVTYFQVRRPRGYFFAPALRRELRKRIRDFDLVYIAWLYVYTTAVAASECRRQKIPYVISPRGMLDKNAILQRSRLKKLFYISVIERSNLRGARAVHFTSAGERENAIVPIPAEMSLIIPNGIEISHHEIAFAGHRPKLDLRIPDDRRVVLFLGRLSYIKGLDLLVTAWPLVIQAQPTAHLVLAGPDDEMLYDAIRRDLERKGLSHSMSYRGIVDQEEKSLLLERCAVLVSPSYLESFGMSIVEAMAQGKPVVITDRVNIFREIDAAGAGLVTGCDADGLAKAIIAVLEDQPRAAEMGKAGQALVTAQFELSAITRRMREAFDSLVARPPTP
jgi:glycosyltransferase involved in cell wall biosynthesis